MTAALDVLPDLDTETQDQLQPPCEMQLPTAWDWAGRAVDARSCDKPAEWIGRSHCRCGQANLDLVCTEHRVWIDRGACSRTCRTCLREFVVAGVQWEELRASARGGA